MTNKTYSAVRITQEGGAKPLVLFAAPATDIESWVGVPQKRQLGENETAGFQRTVSPARRAALEHFFSNPRNVMQNPLLCAIRKSEGTEVSFESSGEVGGVQFGRISIVSTDLRAKTLEELLHGVREYLEERSPELKARAFPDSVYKRLETAWLEKQSDPSTDDDSQDGSDETSQDSIDTELEEALFEESQIAAFWDQLRARERLANKLGDKSPDNALFGFTREVLEAFLRPIVLVDGQHRLEGAVAAEKAAYEGDYTTKQEGEDLVAQGSSADAAISQVMQRRARLLPVSLLLDESPSEHVFQFVVVNQKATPVPKALLATIISTSLESHELSSIKSRLEHADILLDKSQAASSLARNPASPFAGRVVRGFEEDSAGSKLPWTVLATLTDVFRELRGAKYYHDPGLDQADTWKTLHLSASKIVADWQSRDFKTGLDYWKDPNGPWREVFIAFWTQTRDVLANTVDEEAHNFWGRPRTSNIFNKPSLVILTVDFFCFLREQRAGIDSVDHVKQLTTEWLEYVHPTYFSRDWKLDGVKKDSVGTRRQWSHLWYTHRSSGGPPPRVEDFSKLRRE
jgi:hypothetical protein